MEINVKINISRDTLESIFVTALEGGSNHWYYISEDTYRLIRAYIPKEEEPILSLALFSCVYDYDVPLAINDAENPDEEPIGFLCRRNFEQKLQKCYDNHPWAIHNEINEEGDAESSDIIFQYLVLGSYDYC